MEYARARPKRASRGRYGFRQGNYRQLHKFAKDIKALNPGGGLVYVLEVVVLVLFLGNTAFTDGRLNDAETSFRKELEAAPHNPGASNNLAMVALARNGSLPEAEALAQDALRNAGPLRPYVLDTLANIYLRQERYADAFAAINQAEEATPVDNLKVREQLQKTRKSIGDAAQAGSGKYSATINIK